MEAARVHDRELGEGEGPTNSSLDPCYAEKAPSNSYQDPSYAEKAPPNSFTRPSMTEHFGKTPGNYLASWMRDTQTGLKELSDRSSIEVDDLDEILQGKRAVSWADARKLQNATGVSVHIWWDLECQRRESLQ